MGGMTCLEYPLNTPPGFVRHIIPIATAARQSAWCISWGEAQRQSIYSDPEYRDGYYYETADGGLDLTSQPSRGLAAARMSALLTYRSRDSFESRFGRRAGLTNKGVPQGGVRIMGGKETTDPSEPGTADLQAKGPRTPGEVAWREHNDGYRPTGSRKTSETGINGGDKVGTGVERPPKVFSAQSYLRYQGDKVSLHHIRADPSSPAALTPTAISTLRASSKLTTYPTRPYPLHLRISHASFRPSLRMPRPENCNPPCNMPSPCSLPLLSLASNLTASTPRPSRRSSLHTSQIPSSYSLPVRMDTMGFCSNSRPSTAG